MTPSFSRATREGANGRASAAIATLDAERRALDEVEADAGRSGDADLCVPQDAATRQEAASWLRVRERNLVLGDRAPSILLAALPSERASVAPVVSGAEVTQAVAARRIRLAMLALNETARGVSETSRT